MSKIILEGISLDEFEARIEKIVERKLSALSLSKEDPYLTRKEVCTLLHISVSTLHRLITNGSLIPCRMGKKVYFTRSSIDKVLLYRQNN